MNPGLAKHDPAASDRKGLQDSSKKCLLFCIAGFIFQNNDEKCLLTLLEITEKGGNPRITDIFCRYSDAIWGFMKNSRHM